MRWRILAGAIALAVLVGACGGDGADEATTDDGGSTRSSSTASTEATTTSSSPPTTVMAFDEVTTMTGLDGGPVPWGDVDPLLLAPMIERCPDVLVTPGGTAEAGDTDPGRRSGDLLRWTECSWEGDGGTFSAWAGGEVDGLAPLDDALTCADGSVECASADFSHVGVEVVIDGPDRTVVVTETWTGGSPETLIITETAGQQCGATITTHDKAGPDTPPEHVVVGWGLVAAYCGPIWSGDLPADD